MADAPEGRSDKFSFGPGAVVSQCVLCSRFVSSRFGSVCSAFPGGIPDPVMLNEADHRVPYPGGQEDHTVFTPRPDVDPGVLAALYRKLDSLHPKE